MSLHGSCNVEFRTHSHANNVNRQESMNVSRMHGWVEAVRDTVIVVAFQMILRATLMMRRWNY
jgi:hypothetical protein